MWTLPYPWLEAPKKPLQSGASLFVAQGGIGVEALLPYLAAGIFCESGEESPCGTCRHCTLIQRGEHPDFRYLDGESQPTKESGEVDKKGTKGLSVALIRETLRGFAATTPTSARGKVLVIMDAHLLTRGEAASANTLLKTLEEPRAGFYFILCTPRPSALLATIKSRCVLYSLRLPKPEHARAWLLKEGLDESLCQKALLLGGGAPLTALSLARSDSFLGFIEHIDSLLKGGEEPVPSAYADALPAALGWLRELVQLWIREKMRGSDEIAAFPAPKLPLSELFRSLDKIESCLQKTEDGLTLNIRALFENLFVRWRLLLFGKL